MNQIIPTDFSQCANDAINFAIQSAKVLPVKLTLLHSFELTGIPATASKK
ncbi:MAG: hypothetical protein ABI091_04010 [Ferruginibacter sp.]